MLHLREIGEHLTLVECEIGVRGTPEINPMGGSFNLSATEVPVYSA